MTLWLGRINQVTAAKIGALELSPAYKNGALLFLPRVFHKEICYIMMCLPCTVVLHIPSIKIHMNMECDKNQIVKLTTSRHVQIRISFALHVKTPRSN